MSGHNKWSKIKHKKASADAQKSKVFSKLSLFITQESKKASGDVNSPGLRGAIEKAKGVNMPAENIDRAIKKGLGADAGALEEVFYEAYGPGGVGVVISGLTDNKNRTAAEVKHILTKNNTALAGPGAVIWNFEKKDTEWIPKTTTGLSQKEEECLRALSEELEELDDIQSVFTNFSP